jgi:hypothetical protein
MDLYSADVGAIQEGNMRSQAVMDANNSIIEHNNNLAGQIAQLKSGQRTGDIAEGVKDAIGGTIAGGKIAGKIQAYKSWTATMKGNPISQVTKQLSDNLKNSVTAPPTSTELKDTGDGIFESEGALDGEKGALSSAKTGIKNALGVSDEALDTAGKGLGEAMSVGMAGMDIYKDIKAGGIAGDNWASKTSNILQIGGAIADVGGTVFPPLALLGGVLDIASGVGGEIGDLIDDKKQDQATNKLQQQQTQQTQTQTVSAPASTGRVS